MQSATRQDCITSSPLLYKSDIPSLHGMTSPAPPEARCPSRLPQGPLSTTWRMRLEYGVGAKARMMKKKPADAFPVAVDYHCKNGKVTKSFTFFESPADLFRQTAEMRH